jgi:hypothetical protein
MDGKKAGLLVGPAPAFSDVRRRWQNCRGRSWIYIWAAAIAGVAAYVVWKEPAVPGPPDGIASGNGRIEAVEIDIVAKTAGRLHDVLVSEGAFVRSGQPVAQMDTVLPVAKKRRRGAASPRLDRDRNRPEPHHRLRGPRKRLDVEGAPLGRNAARWRNIRLKEL